MAEKKAKDGDLHYPSTIAYWFSLFEDALAPRRDFSRGGSFLLVQAVRLFLIRSAENASSFGFAVELIKNV